MKVFTAALMFLSIVSLVACTKGGKPDGYTDAVYSVTSTATSKQLVPAIDTTFSGTLSGLYDEQANILSFTVTWNDLWRTTARDTITSVNFYTTATTATMGNLLRSLPFTNTNSAGSINLGLAGNTGMTESEKSGLFAGTCYFTIITKRYQSGIIRGQLAVAKK